MSLEAEVLDVEASATLCQAAAIGPIWKQIFEQGFSARQMVALFWLLENSYAKGRVRMRVEGFDILDERLGRLDVLGALCGIPRGGVHEVLESLLDAGVILDGPKGSRISKGERDWSEIEFLPDASNWRIRPRVKPSELTRKELTERSLAELNADLVQQEFRGSLGRVIGLKDALASLSRQAALEQMAQPSPGTSQFQ